MYLTILFTRYMDDGLTAVNSTTISVQCLSCPSCSLCISDLGLEDQKKRESCVSK